MSKQQTKLVMSLLRQATSTAQSGKIDRASAFLQKAVGQYRQLPSAAQVTSRAALVASSCSVASEALARENFDDALSAGLTGWSYTDIEKDDLLYFDLVTALGRAHIAVGDLDAAEHLARQCLDSTRQTFGENSLRVLDLSVDLLALLHWQGRNLEADVLRLTIDRLAEPLLQQFPDKVQFFVKRLDELMADGFAESWALMSHPPR